ncbi:hypothetical protein Vadar_034583 [Vaccinium darrowii]|uniref:Uncharacterized protein n=1 Tax=Vaccinium darrowii TaxID=229202 RepID=A0ACB7X6W0_9ERIC|nr:hypothetical protein Vadar_034583 [Vaccinium darrowii]
MNDMQIRGFKILVKFACFSYPEIGGFYNKKKQDYEKVFKLQWRPKIVNHPISAHSNYTKKILKPIKVMDVGNEWLRRSAIAKLPPDRSIALVAEHLRSLGHVNVEVKPMGSNFVVQRKNLIHSLTVDGILVEDPDQVKLAVLNHFQNIYAESRVVRPSIGDKLGDGINTVLSLHLTADFNEEEVWNIIKTCDGNKAPGPDGLNMLNIKKGWNFMKKDIMDFLMDFHKNEKLPKVTVVDASSSNHNDASSSSEVGLLSSVAKEVDLLPTFVHHETKVLKSSV